MAKSSDDNDERAVKSIADQFQRIRGGRSLRQLRLEMANEGIAIGTSTLQRAEKGLTGLRVESLFKLCEFSGDSPEDFLRDSQPGEGRLPLSAPLRKSLSTLSPSELRTAENVLRAHLGLDPLPQVGKDKAA